MKQRADIHIYAYLIKSSFYIHLLLYRNNITRSSLTNTMDRTTRSYAKDKKSRKTRKRTLTGGSTSERSTTGSRTSSAASSRERSASTSSRLSNKSGSSSVKSGGHKSTTVVNERGKNICDIICFINHCIFEMIFRFNVISLQVSNFYQYSKY